MTAHRLRRVALAERSYDIVIGRGALDELGPRARAFSKRAVVALVADESAYAHHGDRARDSLKRAGLEATIIKVAPGEGSKSFESLRALTEALLKAGVERGDLVIALGGGVVGDLAGFASAILRRGCDFAQVPTTLLAQVDSAVGGKTAINADAGKNLIGAFHQPRFVIADTATLDTLPARERRAGYAEIVKYAAIADAGFFDWLERRGAGAISGRDEDALAEAIDRSCAMKAAIVAEDERERGRRALLNFGHTFAHALEAAAGYDGSLLHGEAVAIGMTMAFDFSVALELCPPEDAARFRAHLAALGLAASLAEAPKRARPGADALLDLMRQDKKVEDGALTLILSEGIGEARIHKNAPIAPLRRFLKETLDAIERTS